MKRAPEQTEESKCVSFRLPPAELEELDRLAGEHNTTRGHFARGAVRRVVRDGGGVGEELSTVLQELFAEVETLHHQVETLHHAIDIQRCTLVTVLETLLLNLTSASKDQVLEWVRAKFPPDSAE